MKQVSLVVMLAMALLAPANSKKGDNPFLGRWDITVTMPTGAHASWMEAVEKDEDFQVRVQLRGGPVRQVNAVKLGSERLILTLNPAAEDRPAIVWELSLNGNQLMGTQKRGDSVQGQLMGVRAPELKSKPPKAWTNPEQLFNGKDLTGWEPGDAPRNHWLARSGELVNEERGSNLRTIRKFDDFKLHFEVNCPQGANTGVYLRGRYQIQIDYDQEWATTSRAAWGPYSFPGSLNRLASQAGRVGELRRDASRALCDPGSRRGHDHRQPGDPWHHRRCARQSRGRPWTVQYSGKPLGWDQVPEHHCRSAQALTSVVRK